MKKVKFQEKTEKELTKLLNDKREAFTKFKFGISGSRTKNVKEGRTLRREMASIITALNKEKK